MISRVFRDATIGKRLIFFIIAVVLLPTAFVLALFYGQFYNIIQYSLLDSQVVTSLQAAQFIDNTAETLLSVCNTITEDERLPLLLAADATSDTEDNGIYKSAADTLGAVIESHVKSNSLSAIRIYADFEGRGHSESRSPAGNQDSAGADADGLISDISEIRNTYWYGIFATSDTRTLFAPEFYLSASERARYGSLAVIRKHVFEIDGEDMTVFTAVYTYDDILVTPIRDIELESVEGIISFIINSRESVVAQTDETAYGTYAMTYDEIAGAIPAEGVFIRKEVAGTDVFMTYRDIGFTDWRMAWIVPQASILAQSSYVIFQFVAIYLAMALIVLIVGIFISRTIVGRIESLRNQMGQVKTERPLPLTLEPGKDEVGDLIEAYNYMVGRINTLLDDTIEAAEELRSEEIKVLRAQIDPHFLYNTLDMIKWLISARSNDKAMDAIIALSKFYRLTLNRGKPTATVEAELEHVSLYVKLMNMRFDERIDYLVDMPEDMLDYEIPLIIFQPIVENAIQHGIFEKPSQSGKIIITGWSDDDTLYFLISDDGIGMSAEQISSLLLDTPGKDNDSSGRNGNGKNGKGGGIGIYNTHRRLQLMYGRDDCGLEYCSEYGKGTDVTLRIPKDVEGGKQ